MAERSRAEEGREDIERRVADLFRVLEISRRFAAPAALPPLLELIEQSVVDVLDCEHVDVYCHDPATDAFYASVAGRLEAVRLPAGNGTVGEVFQRRIIVNRAGDGDEPRLDREDAGRTGPRARNVLICPLPGWDNRVVGVLQAWNSRSARFDAWDEVLARTLGAQAGVAIQRQLRLDELRGEGRLWTDVDLARQIQQVLLPKHSPVVPGFDIAGWNQPAAETGGDFFDFVERPGGRLAIAVADVSGHGLGAALVAAECRAFLRAILAETEEPGQVAVRLNRLLCESLPPDRFITAFFGLLHPDTYRLEYVSSGHGPLLFSTRADPGFRELTVQDCPLGLLPDGPYGPPGVVAFEPGDLLAIVTDGFIEWCDAQLACFGRERLQDCLRRERERPAAEIIRCLHQAVLRFAGGNPQRDDLTAILIKRP